MLFEFNNIVSKTSILQSCSNTLLIPSVLLFIRDACEIIYIFLNIETDIIICTIKFIVVSKAYKTQQTTLDLRR